MDAVLLGIELEGIVLCTIYTPEKNWQGKCLEMAIQVSPGSLETLAESITIADVILRV